MCDTSDSDCYDVSVTYGHVLLYNIDSQYLDINTWKIMKS